MADAIAGRDPARLLSAALDLGEEMLVCGGEVNRVEDTLKRLLTACGAAHVDVFTITSSIVVTVESADWGILTQTRRVPAQAFNLARLSALNDLSRRCCRCPMSPAELSAAIAEIDSAPRLGWIADMGVWALVSISFCVFFGGTLTDGLFSALVGTLLYLARRFLVRIRLNSYLTIILLSVLGGLLARFSLATGLDVHPSAISIGNIMLLIPGITLTNSMRDMFSGDTITGLLRSAEAIVLSLAIGWGFAVSAADSVSVGVVSVPVALISAFLGSVGFGLLFNVRGRNLLLGALGSTAAYAVVLGSIHWGANEIAAYFLASLCVGLWAELLARRRRCPITLFLVVGIISLVPGGALYRTMRFALAGEWSAFGVQGLQTALYAIAISAGIVCVTAVADVLRRRIHS